ncbi:MULTISPECIES: MFS transporter [unclassified Microbacterium]|uniref:MFS transporter n=1 Tax=unclassified Microbacterium TaxID=2609290 RepID=UPI00301046D9
MAGSAHGRSARLTIGVLALTGMIASLQFTLLMPALPLVPAELGVPAEDAVWLVTITLLTGTLGTPVLTRLGDLYGRRRMLLLSVGLLVVGSVVAASVPSFTAVLIGRALQGTANAAIPLGIGLMAALLDRTRAVLGIALMSGTLGIGSALGLVLSGVLTAAGGLPAIFWFSAVAGVVVGGLIAMTTRESPRGGPQRFDVLGTALLAVALTALLLLISKGTSWGLTSAAGIVCAVVAVLGFAIWFPWEWRHPRPVVDVRAALRAPVLQINIASFFATFGMFANHLLTMQEALGPVETRMGLGLPEVVAGAVLAPSAVLMILLAPAAARALSRFGGRATLCGGCAVMAAAFLFRAVAHGDVVLVVLGSGLVGAGIAFAFAAMPALITEASPAADVAAANGVNSLVRALSGAVASAAFAFALVSWPATADPDFLSDTGLTASLITVAGFSAAAGALALVVPRRGAAGTRR